MNDPAVLAQWALRARMAAALREGVVAAVDAGGTKTACAIAKVDLGRLALGNDREADAYSALRVLGAAQVPSAGMHGGAVVDPDAAAGPIRSAVAEAKNQAGAQIESAILVLSSGMPRTLRAGAETAIPSSEVDDAMVARLMANCRPELAHRLRRPLLVEPAGFTVDGTTAVRDPRGSPAHKLALELAILTVERSALQALIQAAVLAGLGVDGVVSASVASALACLTEDEMELGAVCADMGGAVTGLAAFRAGRFHAADWVPVGGERVTADLAEALEIGREEAEALKIREGGPVAADLAILGGADTGETSTMMVGVVRPRLEEIFEMIRLRLDALEGEMPRPVVLTGGASRLPGTIDVAQAVLDRRVRLGRSIRVAGAAKAAPGPDFAAALGTLAYAVRCERDPWTEAMEIASESERKFSGVTDWFRRNW